tara:strand:+ start:876 stop:1781 length:906 start_codon:yes stop_codon:yes gene_type:complete
MKIDKIVFSTSEEYSGFWNIQSKIWKSVFDIEPVCILFGKKENTNMKEDYGTIIEREFEKDLPKVLQITWSKFDYPKTEPDTVWMLGDIDMVPLQKFYFTDNIKDAPENAYLHLNFAGISLVRRGILDAFLKEGSESIARSNGSYNTGADLPGHYHVSKGSNFQKIFNLDRTFREQVDDIASSHRHGLGPAGNSEKPQGVDEIVNAGGYYWCAEESYSSEKLFYAVQNKQIEFYGYCYHNGHNRIDRSTWSNDKADYFYDKKRLSSGSEIVDIHCERPYEKQENALNEIVELSGIFETVGV